MKIWLLANYEADTSESMHRYAQSLEAVLKEQGGAIEVERIVPPRILHRFALIPGARKWVGYLDNYLLFPLSLRRRLRRERPDVIHICDHGNAPWRLFLADYPVSLTLHDLITVRAARGEETGVRPSRLGRIQQDWIVKGLAATNQIVCDSEATREDLEAILPGRPEGSHRVVYIAPNQPLHVVSDPEAHEKVAAHLQLRQDQPYLLHIGSNVPRKNRTILLDVLARLHAAGKTDFVLVLAGQGLDNALRARAETLGVLGAVREWPQISSQDLATLYSGAYAFLFPSLSEGFGYPVVEAQSCDCPVICSACGSLKEVAADSTLLCDPHDVEALVAAVVSLESPEQRQAIVEKGRINAHRFTAETMAREMIAFFQQVRVS